VSTCSLVQELKLPLPDTKESRLSAAINDQMKESSSLTKAALAMSFNEEVGLGAVSRAGALPSGVDGQWLKLVEDKIKKENVLDYQSLLWELGSEIAEMKQVDLQGLNLTYEQELLSNMKEWFYRRGGKLNLLNQRLRRKVSKSWR
jgi:hypothetical protein